MPIKRALTGSGRDPSQPTVRSNGQALTAPALIPPIDQLGKNHLKRTEVGPITVLGRNIADLKNVKDYESATRYGPLESSETDMMAERSSPYIPIGSTRLNWRFTHFCVWRRALLPP